MNKYKLFDEPKNAFNNVFRRIKSAKKSIYIESYRIANDSIGRDLIDLLINKSNKGIEVKIIVDDLGWDGMSKNRLKRLHESKIEFHIFNPWFKSLSWKSIKKHWNIHFRNHRKLTIVDEKYAYIGGMNYSSREIRWRDMMVEITGEIVGDLISSSNEMLGICKKKNLKKRKIFKKLSRKFNSEDIIVRQIPYSKHRLLKKELIKIFNSAKDEIIIATPYLVPDVPFRRALRRAVIRGVKITIMIPKKADGWMATMMNHFGSYLATQSGIKINLHPNMMHSKYVIVDQEVCSFGSANLDYQTFNHNYELNIISNNSEIVKQLKKSFKKDSKVCKDYEEKSWSKRIWINRIIMGFLIKHKRHF